jgi:hypothetical protein
LPDQPLTHLSINSFVQFSIRLLPDQPLTHLSIIKKSTPCQSISFEF